MSEETTCPACGRATRTVSGMCQHCGAAKDPERMAASAPVRRRASLWGQIDGVLVIGGICAVAVPVAILLLPEMAVIVILLVVAVMLAGVFLDG